MGKPQAEQQDEDSARMKVHALGGALALGQEVPL